MAAMEVAARFRRVERGRRRRERERGGDGNRERRDRGLVFQATKRAYPYKLDFPFLTN